MKKANRCPTHPGEILREDVLPAIGVGKSAFAEGLGISRQHLYDILNEKKPVSPEIAVRLGAALGNGASLWLNLQGAYDAWHAARKVDTSKIPLFKAA